MNGAPKHYFEFDAFRVDVEERRLLRDGKLITLTAKVFDILLALVESSGRTVGKDELMQTVWEDTFVEEGNLSQHISTLRKLLNDDRREQKFIKTIPKRGYRFTAAVHEVVEESETHAFENVSRSRLVIREETREGFWTQSRLAIAATLLIGAGFLGAWALTAGSAGNVRRATRMSANTEASEAYSKGRELWRTRSAGSLYEATALLEKAVQKDPDFALAHSALADAYAFDVANWKKAEDEADVAIKLDPNSGEPHASIGFVKMFWQWDLSGAEAEFKQAVALSPNYATGHQWYAANLAATGHADAALVEIGRATELEPSSAAMHSDKCQILYFGGKFQEALAECQKTLQLDPALYSANEHIYDIYSALEMNDEAVKKFFDNKVVAGSEMLPSIAGGLRRAYAEGGITGFRTAQLDYYSHTDLNYYRLAQTYARLGDDDKAYETLRASYEKKDFDLVFVGADPVFGRLQIDVRMNDLMDKFHPAKRD